MIGKSEYERALREVRLKFEDSLDREPVIEYLKGAGFSQIACIRAMIDLGMCTASEAKRVVHYSLAWSSTRSQSEDLQEGLAKALDPDA
ncbi:hypothetical protein GCM10010430_17750 [Kitasatospora cystarginea]|uniref:Uncharacterized protein n=1 Tax=Kitasatospora cystarginea TaxID=58350 RepID=A0ABN3DN82_9ACTN